MLIILISSWSLKLLRSSTPLKCFSLFLLQLTLIKMSQDLTSFLSIFPASLLQRGVLERYLDVDVPFGFYSWKQIEKKNEFSSDKKCTTIIVIFIVSNNNKYLPVTATGKRGQHASFVTKDSSPQGRKCLDKLIIIFLSMCSTSNLAVKVDSVNIQ